LLRQGCIVVKPLADFARQNGAESLSVSFHFPESEVRETQPSAQARSAIPPQYPQKYAKRLRDFLDRQRVFVWSLDAPMPAALTYSFGLSVSTAAKSVGILLSFMLLPILLVAWLGRKALGAETQDKAAVWFSYTRYLQWTINGSLILWWAAVESVHLDSLLGVFLAGTAGRVSWVSSLAFQLIKWTAPLITWVGCLVLSQPVQRKLRDLPWTRRELFLQALFTFSSVFLPLGLFFAGFNALLASSARSAVLLWVAAGLVRVVARGKLVKLMGIEPQALDAGELRDAAFKMAERLGVKLQQVLMIRSGKSRMANAFARTGNTIAFTDHLLERMSRREVNFVLGHELSHLRMKHPAKLAIALGASLCVAILAAEISRPFVPDSPMLRYGMIFIIATVIPYFWSRRFEYAADAGAVAVTGDPQGAISALFKLASLNMHPLQWSKWSEKWITHPSMVRRAEAIARKAGIPAGQTPDIARTAFLEQDRYSLPASLASGKKPLFSSSKKSANLQLITFSVLGSMILTAIGIGWLVQWRGWSDSHRQLLYLLGLPAVFAASFAVANGVSNRRLQFWMPAIKSKLQGARIECDAWGGIPIGLVPADRPRIYEGHTHWDLGFLFIRSDRLCYWGEHTQFAVLREQIKDLRLGPGHPGWFRSRRIYVAWRDDSSGEAGTFHISTATHESVLAMRKRTLELFDQLIAWQRSSTPTSSLPQALGALKTPTTGTVTGVSPAVLRKPRRILKELWLTGLIAAMGAVLAGLPFHLMAYLNLENVVGQVQFKGPGPGWYVVAAVVLVRFAQFVPVFFYKESPVVQSQATATVNRPHSVSDTPLSKSEAEDNDLVERR
jgi:Zn-dependent protease with chaperone function